MIEFFSPFILPFLTTIENRLHYLLYYGLLMKKTRTTTYTIRKAFVLAICLAAGLLWSSEVSAADSKPTIRDAGYRATFVSQSIPDPIEIEAGASQKVVLKFKNTGTQTWNALSAHPNGYRHVSAYTMEPRDRASVFTGLGWLSAKQAGSISKDTKPGEVAELSIILNAPEKIGTYTESFYLAAENYSWVQGGYFFFKINVVPKKIIDVAPSPASASADVSAEPANIPVLMSARVVNQSKKEVSLVGGQEDSLVIIYNNDGTAAWNGYEVEVNAPGGLADSGHTLSFASASWPQGFVATKSEVSTAPSAYVREKVMFRAPVQEGDYTATFRLRVASEAVEGSEAHLNVHVTQNAPLEYVPPTFSDTRTFESIPAALRLSEEPRVRVGLEAVADSVQFVSFSDDYRILSGGQEIGVLERMKPVTLSFTDDAYQFIGASLDISSPSFFRLEPVNNPHAVYTIKRGLKDRSIAWVGAGEFLNYRGAFEFRHGDVDGKPYVVNDVLIEDYVEGISENGKGTSLEAIKANLVAARTYAYLSHGKYPFFDVLGSTYDQLYLGDDVKDNLVDVAPSAKATRGQMVTYQGEIVMTPYFGNSNGTTKSWSSVWGGAIKPWLVPVAATYDAGRRQFGHGVGMSQRDAALRAKNDGWVSDQILKHYYTGTEVERIYQ